MTKQIAMTNIKNSKQLAFDFIWKMSIFFEYFGSFMPSLSLALNVEP